MVGPGALAASTPTEMMPIIKQFQDSESLAYASADAFLSLYRAAIADHDHFRVALAGGSTPTRLYQLLATLEYKPKINWKTVHLYWGDERCVPPEHPDSNYRSACEHLIDQILIPPRNVFRMPGEVDPEKGALTYEHLLFRSFSYKTPVFDLILLGVGEDGHIVSLFPGDPTLNERKRWVLPVRHAQPPEPLVDRLTLTLPILNFARYVIFLVSGDSKALVARRILVNGEKLPAALVKPVNGHIIWMLDKEAGGAL